MLVKMIKPQPYYYEDVVFQLELNLQIIRRALIKLLEDHQFNDCFDCNRLKCCCFETQSSLRSTTLSIPTDSTSYCDFHDISMRSFYNAAPPAESLPTPEWTANSASNVSSDSEEESVSIAAINAWIRASIPNSIQSNTRLFFPVPRKILEELNYSWPPFPKSIWSDEKLRETTERESIFCTERERVGNNSVAAFFRYFSGSTKNL